MSGARQFLLAEIAFLLGVALADVRVPPWWFVAMLATSSAVIARTVRLAPAVLVLLPLAFALGMLRLWQSEVQWRADPILSFAERSVTLAGTVSREPDVRLDRQRLTLDVTAVRDGDREERLQSRVLATLPLYPEYAYGDALTLRCRLRVPERFDRFAYDEYLALDGIHMTCNRGIVLARSSAPGATIVRFALIVKQWFAARLSAALPEPQASFAAALLVGARRAMPEATLAAFQTVGLTHLIALSGYNITILVAAFGAAGRALGAGRRPTFWATALLLALFVLMTGASASVVRAALMGTLVLVALQIGRPSTMRYVLCATATLMVAVHPRILLHDVGFQLSFLATAGLFLAGSWWQERLRCVPETLQLRMSLATTFAASTLTLPLLILVFGRLSLVSPLANVLVLPLMPLAMLGAALSALPIVGTAAAWLAWPVLTWVLGLAHLLALVPAANVAISPAGVLRIAIAGTLMFLLLRHILSRRHAHT